MEDYIYQEQSGAYSVALNALVCTEYCPGNLSRKKRAIEGDGIKFRLPFKIFSTLSKICSIAEELQLEKQMALNHEHDKDHKKY